MKKFVNFFLIISFFHVSLTSISAQKHPKDYDNFNPTWISVYNQNNLHFLDSIIAGSDTYYFQFNQAGNFQKIFQDTNSKGWKENFEYNSKGDLITHKRDYGSVSTGWNEHEWEKYNYDNKNRLSEKFWMTIDGLGGEHVIHNEIYDSLGNLLSFRYKLGPNNYSKTYLNEYNADNQIIRKIKIDSLSETRFDTTYYVYKYDIEKNLIEKTETIFNYFNQLLENKQKEVYSYNGSIERIGYLKQYWNDTGWVNWERITYERDENGLLQNKYYENYEYGEWIFNQKYLYQYNSNNLILEEYYESRWNKNRRNYTYDGMNNIIFGKSEEIINEEIELSSFLFGLDDKYGNRFTFIGKSFNAFYTYSQNIVNYVFSIESPSDISIFNLFESSFIEGGYCLFKPIDLPEPFENHQKQVNILEGSRLSLDEDAINEDVSLDIRFMGFDPTINGGIINPVDNTPLFMFLGIEVTGDSSGITSFEDLYHFNEGKKARICILRTQKFFELLAELEIDPGEIDFSYLRGGEYFKEGLVWEIIDGIEGNPDSICIYLDHFSKIVGGKNLITSVNKIENELPSEYRLYQNFPNPFNPTTIIQYSIPEAGLGSVELHHVNLKIYDVLGSEVVTIVDELQKPGNYETSYDGNKLSSGIYYYQIITGSFSQTKKMILLK